MAKSGKDNSIWRLRVTVGVLVPGSKRSDSEAILQEKCRFLIEAGDATLDSAFSPRRMLGSNLLLRLGGGQRATFHQDTYDGTWTRGYVYRKLDNIWVSFEMTVPGGRQFMGEILSRTNFPEDIDKMLDYMKTVTGYKHMSNHNLCIGARTASFIVSDNNEGAHVKCLWMPDKKELGLLAGKQSMNTVTAKYAGHSLYRFADDLIFLEKDILASCGLRTIDVRKKDPAAIAMAAMVARQEPEQD